MAPRRSAAFQSLSSFCLVGTLLTSLPPSTTFDASPDTVLRVGAAQRTTRWPACDDSGVELWMVVVNWHQLNVSLKCCIFGGDSL